MTPTASASWFRLDRFPGVRDTLPAAIREIMQNGLLDRAFQDALLPEFLFPAVAQSRPWRANLGDTVQFTRTGLLAPVDTPITGSDPSASTYGIESYSMTMEQYGNAVDTNMLQSAMTLASKFLEDQQKLAVNAGQSLNRIARSKLYGAYRGGRTWATAGATSDSTIVVYDTAGFTHVLVDGKPTPVSASNPLPITIEGVANTVTAVDTGTNTLTLGTARVDVVGDAVVSNVAPYSIRAGSRDTAYDLTASDVATFALFRSAVARLRRQNVPTVQGTYVAHIDASTEEQLFADTEFQALYRGRAESETFRNQSIGVFGGITWVRNEEVETLPDAATAASNVEVTRPVVVGGQALVAGPFEDMGNLLTELGAASASSEVTMLAGPGGINIARIIRAPQDRLQQVVGSAWSWVGDFAVPSDSVTGDASVYKRAVVVEHAA